MSKSEQNAYSIVERDPKLLRERKPTEINIELFVHVHRLKLCYSDWLYRHASITQVLLILFII